MGLLGEVEVALGTLDLSYPLQHLLCSRSCSITVKVFQDLAEVRAACLVGCGGLVTDVTLAGISY